MTRQYSMTGELPSLLSFVALSWPNFEELVSKMKMRWQTDGRTDKHADIVYQALKYVYVDTHFSAVNNPDMDPDNVATTQTKAYDAPISAKLTIASTTTSLSN